MPSPLPRILVRPASLDDEPFVIETAQRLSAFPVPEGRTAVEIVEGEVRTLAAHFRAPADRNRLLVGVGEDGARLGFVFLETVRDYFSTRPHAHIGILAVTAESEGLGAGRALLAAAEAWARDNGFDRLTLNVFERNEHARRVYEHLGYRPETLRYVKLLLFLIAVAVVGWPAPVGRSAVCAGDRPAPPASAFTVLDPQPPAGPRITEYLRHQLDRAWEQDAARLAAWSAVRTPADLDALKRRTRTRLLAAIGGLPAERTPLNARVVGTVAGQGYRIEKIIFESLPGLHVTALLYVPEDGAVRHPAMLVACGHSADGKAFRNYQEISVRLARRGYVVLCWDPVGQGERSQFWDAARGRSRYNLICGEHAVLGNLACLAGANLARWEAWDGIRAHDYLLTRPEVDPRRVGITGTSGGGFQAATIGALDERLSVVAPSCYVTSLPMRMANRIFDDPDSDPEQDPFGSVSGGIDHPGLLLLVHPRALVVASAVKDFVPIEGARRTVREIASVYRRFGPADRLAFAEGVHEHRFSDENQAAVFAFLDRVHGLPARRGGFEPFTPLPSEALRCTPSGQVRTDVAGDRPLTEIIREHYQAARERPRVTLGELYRGNLYPGIAQWTATPWTGSLRRASIAFEKVGSTSVDEVVIDRYVLHHGTLLLPLLHVHAAHAPTGSPRRVVLDVGLEGKAGPGDWPRVRDAVERGDEVVSFDLRGTGETRMRYRVSGESPGGAAADEWSAYADPLSGVLANYVYNSLLTGRPYFLELLEDIEIAARFCRLQLGATQFEVSARGEAEALARAAGEVLPGLHWYPQPGVRPFSWVETVERLSEAWPIQYLLPGGALLGASDAR